MAIHPQQQSLPDQLIHTFGDAVQEQVGRSLDFVDAKMNALLEKIAGLGKSSDLLAGAAERFSGGRQSGGSEGIDTPSIPSRSSQNAVAAGLGFDRGLEQTCQNNDLGSTIAGLRAHMHSPDISHVDRSDSGALDVGCHATNHAQFASLLAAANLRAAG